jgi:hypothetical protein
MQTTASLHPALTSRKEHWLLAGLVAIGSILRLRQYVFGRSLWLDEAILANNLLDRSLGSLLAEPLAGVQVAPPGYLIAQAGAISVLGTSEQALRATALAASLATLVVALLLAREVFSQIVARATFVGLVAVSPVLVYYGNEVKQYAFDVLATTVVLWVFVSFERWPKGPAVLAATGSAVVWPSHASVFVLAGVGALLAVRWAREGAFGRLAGVGLAWAASAALMLWCTPSSPAATAALRAYWQSAFAPFPPLELADAWWYPHSLLGLVHLGWRESGVPDALPVEAWTQPLTFVLLAPVLVGAWALARRRPQLAAAIGITLATLVAVSAAGVYPARSRPVLFLVPVAFLLAAESVEWLSTRRSFRARPVFTGILVVGLIALPVWISGGLFLEPRDGSDTRGALRHVTAFRGPDDALVISAWTGPAFRFYRSRFGLDDGSVAGYVPADFDAESFITDVVEPTNLGRTHLVFSHRLDEVPGFISGLPRSTTILERWDGDGSVVYLVDFSDAGPER